MAGQSSAFVGKSTANIYSIFTLLREAKPYSWLVLSTPMTTMTATMTTMVGGNGTNVTTKKIGQIPHIGGTIAQTARSIHF